MNSRFPPHVLVEDCSKNLVAEVLGLVWLSLKGVCVLCVSALSVCKGWGHLVAPLFEPTMVLKRCNGFCRPHTFNFPGLQKYKEDTLGGSFVDVFRGSQGHFFEHFGTCWGVVAPRRHLPDPSGA